MGYVPNSASFRGAWSIDGGHWDLILAREKSPGVCRVRYCFTPVPLKPSRHKNGKAYPRTLCNRCVTRRWRANNPIRAAYNQIKDRARRRGQHFGISPTEFAWLVGRSNYILQSGRKPEALHIDRIQVQLGYVLSNLQVITSRENAIKRNTVDYPKTHDPF